MKAKSKVKQQGNILVMFTLGLFVLIGMTALALDGGHMLLSKTRLQNIVDASAMHAAKELDSGKTHAEARQAAFNLINLNVQHSDNHELKKALDLSSTTFSSPTLGQHIWVDFYDTPEDLNSTPSSVGEYVRVRISNLQLSNFLAQILNFDKAVSASAQSGPSSHLVNCYYDVVPMLVCAPAPEDDGPPGTYFGLHVFDPEGPPVAPENRLHIMKAGAGSDSIGPGNFQLIRIDDNQGGADIRDAMAGEANPEVPLCYSEPDGEEPGQLVPTEPGNNVGPSSQGLNTRFGQYQGPVNSTDHPSDINNCEGTNIEINDDLSIVGGALSAVTNAYMYDDYLYDNTNSSTLCTNSVMPSSGTLPTGSTNTGGASGRRILTVTIGDCTNQFNGASEIPYLGSGCFYLTQSIKSGGQESFVVGEFVNECSGLGIPAGTTEGEGAQTIVLYHFPDSKDS